MHAIRDSFKGMVEMLRHMGLPFIVGVAATLSACGVSSSSEPVAEPGETVCSSPTLHIQSDGPDYRSLTAFPTAKTVAVVATVRKSEVIREEDMASSLAPFPMDAVTVDVDRVVRGEVGPIIAVARAGGGGCAVDEDVTPLIEGESVILFLQPTRATWRDLAVYLSWGGDQGVYDIDDGIVTQRTPPHRSESLDPAMSVDDAVALIRSAGG